MDSPRSQASAAANHDIPPLQLSPDQHAGTIAAPAPEKERSAAAVDNAAFAQLFDVPPTPAPGAFAQPLDVLPTAAPVPAQSLAAIILAPTPTHVLPPADPTAFILAPKPGLAPAQLLHAPTIDVPTGLRTTDAPGTVSDNAMDVDPHAEGLDANQMDLGLDDARLQSFDGSVNPNMDIENFVDSSDVKPQVHGTNTTFGALDGDESLDSDEDLDVKKVDESLGSDDDLDVKKVDSPPSNVKSSGKKDIGPSKKAQAVQVFSSFSNELKDTWNSELASRDFALSSTLPYVLEAGEDAIYRFDKYKTPIKRSIVKMALTNQAYLPLSATHSAHVALEFFRNTSQNLVCLFHTDNRHSSAKVIDTDEKLTGLPGPVWMRSRFFNPTGPIQQYPDVLSCGCPLDQSLHMFLLWKTLFIKSKQPSLANVWYSMGVRPVLHTPHVPDNEFRSFWIQSLVKTNHVSVFASYQGGITKEQARINLKLRQLQALEKVLRGMGMPLSIVIQDSADEANETDWQNMYCDVMGDTAGDSNEKVMADAHAAAMVTICSYFPKLFSGPSSSSSSK